MTGLELVSTRAILCEFWIFRKLAISCLKLAISWFFTFSILASLFCSIALSEHSLLFSSWLFTTQDCFYWWSYCILPSSTLIFLWNWASASLVRVMSIDDSFLLGDISLGIVIGLETITLFMGEPWTTADLGGHFTFSFTTTCSRRRGEGGKNPECVWAWLTFSSLSWLKCGAICIDWLR